MDLSQEKQVNRIPDEEGGRTSNTEKIASASDPLDNLRDVLLDALAGKPEKKVPLVEEVHQATSPTPEFEPTLSREWKKGEGVENGGGDRAVVKRDRPTRKPPKNGKWRTINVNHFTISEVAEKSTPAASHTTSDSALKLKIDLTIPEEITPHQAHSSPQEESVSNAELKQEPATVNPQTQGAETATHLEENLQRNQGNSTTNFSTSFLTESISNINLNPPTLTPSQAQSETPLKPAEESTLGTPGSDPENKWPTLSAYSPEIPSKLVPELSELQGSTEAMLEGIEQLGSTLKIEKSQHSPEAQLLSTDPAEAMDSMENLQQLLFGSQLSDIEGLKQSLNEYDLPGLRDLLATTNQNLQSLEHQIYEPQKLIELLKPWIAEILTRKISDSKEEVAQALVPIIDEVIKNRSHENKGAMSAAIASLLPSAITQQIKDSPEDVAKALGPEMALAIKEQIRLDRNAIARVLAPEMGRTIKEQIRLERDAMVDALYPVIGNTISKYMTEAIKSINDKVANTLSREGIERKIRSKVQGVSEAELILKESISFVVQAVFLIHKASGLVIAEAQEAGDYRLESEMVAGMLTAIRSFVNDCIVKPGEISELSEVEYGSSKIILEVGGYCYLAIIIKGDPSAAFIKKMRTTVSTLILDYEQPIQEFDGDPANVPDRIPELVQQLMESSYKKPAQKPYALVGLVIGVLSLFFIGGGALQYQKVIHQRLAKNVGLALSSAPELAVYRLDVTAKGNTVIVAGKLPNPELRQKAAEIAAAASGNRTLDNQIIAVDVPPDSTLVMGEVARVREVFNQREGVAITANYANRKVTIEGTVTEISEAPNIVQGFEQIPGVNSVVSTLKLDPLNIPARIYFDSGSVQLNSTYQETLETLKQFLEDYPQKNIRIMGHSDGRGSPIINKRLALQRAQAVQTALIQSGVQPTRLEAVGDSNPPADVDSNQPQLLGRVVLFEPITPEPEN